MSGCSIYQEPEYTLQDLKEKLNEAQNLPDSVENELKNLEDEFAEKQQTNKTDNRTDFQDKSNEDKQGDRNDLQKKVEEQLSEDEEVLKTDFTKLKDGKLSAVIVTGCPVTEDDEYAMYPKNQKLWFVVDDLVTRLDESEDALDWSYGNPEFITENEGTLLYTIKSNGNPYSTALIWRIVNDIPEFIEVTLPWITYLGDGEFEGINRVTTSSVGGMNNLPCYFYWDGQEIREYGSVELNREEFLKLNDAKKYLDEIERIDGKVDSILYQETKNITYIYINYTVSNVNQERGVTEEYYHSAYLSVDCATGKLTPIKVDNNSNFEILNSFLDECDYHAHFVKAVVPEIAVYPEKPQLFQDLESQTEVQRENKPALEQKAENADGNDEGLMPSFTEKIENKSDKNIITGQNNLSEDEFIKQSWLDAKSGSPEKGRDLLEQMYNQTQDSTYLKERLSLCRTYGIPNWKSTPEHENFLNQIFFYLEQKDVQSAEDYIWKNQEVLKSLSEACSMDNTCTIYYKQTIEGKGLAARVVSSGEGEKTYSIQLLYSSWNAGVPQGSAVYLDNFYRPNGDYTYNYSKTTLTDGIADGWSTYENYWKNEETGEKEGFYAEGNVKGDFWIGTRTCTYLDGYIRTDTYAANGRRIPGDGRDVGETVYGMWVEETESCTLERELFCFSETGRRN